MKTIYSKFYCGLLCIIALFLSVSLQAQTICTQFDYYYANITGSVGAFTTDVYSVGLSGGDAVLTAVSLGLPYEAHIAFNEANGLLYLVHRDGAVTTLDPSTGVVGATVAAATPLTHVTSAAINPDGKLLIGDMDSNEIYQAHLETSPYTLTVYDDNGDISGGDIAWTNNGLYLVSKPNGYLYTVLPSMFNILMGDVDDSVNGLASMADGSNVLVSALGNSSFHEYEITGSGVSQVNSYPATLNGETFTLADGDMASGCSGFTNTTGCIDFQYYYINDYGPDVPSGTVMSGTIVGNDFVLTSLFDSGLPNGHLAVNTDNGDFYVVRNNQIRTFSSTGVLLNDVSIPGNIGSIVAAVWNPVNSMLYVGIHNQDKVYELNPADGSNTLFADDVPVNGGDLILDEASNLYIVERHNNSPSELYNITSGSAVFVADVAPSVNGAALTAAGGFIVAEGNSSQSFHVYDAAGNPLSVLNAVDNLGNPMTIVDGDMASGCMVASTPDISTCSYSYFYTDYINQGSSEIYALTIHPDNSVTSSLITTLNYGSVGSAVSPLGSLYIPSRWGNGFYTTWDIATGTQIGGQIQMTSMGGDNIQEVSGGVFHSGLLYVVDIDGNIYGLDPSTGNSQIELSVGSDPSESISDILFDGAGNLWAMSRDAGILYNVTLGTSVSISASEIDGIAMLPNGKFVGVNGDQSSPSLMYEIDPATGAFGTSFTLDFSAQWGDLSSACIESGQDDTPGQCNATQVIEYVEGTSNNGGDIAFERTDPSQALGNPERVDELVFVSLGYGGSITLGFDGYVPNEPGVDIEVVETTYNNNSCSSYPEVADVYVSLNGVDWAFAKTICRADGFIDISDAGDFDHINYVKIVNNNELSDTPDAFDVDGVVALHNCEGDDGTPPNLLESQFTMTAYPNPTTGQAQIVFDALTNGKTTIEIMDMNGRLVETIFNQDVRAGENYSVAFDGSDLPNGIYITKMTTNSEIAIGKIMIAR